MSKKRIKDIALNSGKNIKPIISDDTVNRWYLSDERHLAFSFLYMPNGKYSIDSIKDNKFLALILKRLKKLSNMTWKELKLSNRHASGYETIDKKSINGNIPQSITDDTPIIVFRGQGIHPIAGYRSGKTFHVLFIDRDLTLYKHG